MASDQPISKDSKITLGMAGALLVGAFALYQEVETLSADTRVNTSTLSRLERHAELYVTTEVLDLQIAHLREDIQEIRDILEAKKL